MPAAQWDGEHLRVVASSALPGFREGDYAAAIAVHGQYLYIGLRGSNRVSVLRHSGDDGPAEAVGFVSSERQRPRHLATDGDLLHVANQESGSVARFRLGSDGILSLITEPEGTPTPTCLLAAQ